MLKPGGQALIGLYHTYGRKPFLNHFAEMQAQGASEDTLCQEYKRLHAALQDETHLKSWFRDQVLHPHETQHTISELLPLMADHGITLLSTSINKFKPFSALDDITIMEKDMERIGEERLAKGEYFPGFFVLLCQKAGGKAGEKKSILEKLLG